MNRRDPGLRKVATVPGGGRPGAIRLLALLLSAALVVAACGSGGGGGASAGGGESEVLQPLADGFPNQPITLWNAFEPGHTDDLFNIVVAEIAAKYSPVPLRTDTNPSGPELQYALARFLESQPLTSDGYNVYAVSWFGLSLRPHTIESLVGTPLEALQPIIVMQQAPFVFAVPPDSPYQSLEQLTEAARSRPGELTAVASGTGSGLHSSLLVWMEQAGVDVRFIPTDGAGQSRNTMLGGGADFAVLTYESGMEQQMRVLAVTGDTPVPALPEVPTTESLGLNIPAGSERGYGTVPGVPSEHLDWLYRLFERVANDPEFQQRQPGFTFNVLDREQVRATQRDIQDTFIPVLRDAGLTVG